VRATEESSAALTLRSTVVGRFWSVRRMMSQVGMSVDFPGDTVWWLIAGRRLDERVERILFTLVANRALAPSSKLAATRWIEHDVVIDGLDQVVGEACYRAMDWLVEVAPELSRTAYDNVADLLNLEVDLLFFDTTSTYFELDEPDEPVGRDEL
jgi:hypothetical protein